MKLFALAVCAASLSFASVSHAQSKVKGDASPLFVAKKGEQEFSGRLIARPLQIDAHLSQGSSATRSVELHAQAITMLQGTLIRTYAEVDEYVIRVPQGSNENEFARQLMASGLFEYVEPDWILYPVAIPNDPLYGNQWHHPRINAPSAWDHFVGNGTVTIAITDTGIRLDHQDFVGRLVSGANSASGTATPQSSGGNVNDINGHGTHCAGIAAAAGNNGIGVAGIGWNTKIMPIRVTNSSGGSASLSALTAGARWAADNGARVVSTSYSGVSSSSVQTTGAYIKNTRNGVYCWAAGNDNAQRTNDHADVTIVGASTQSDSKASFSAYGPAIDVFAPGVDILSTYHQSSSQYVYASGTSMACPLAAGLAALITGTNPSLTAQQIETILYQTCFDLTASPGGVGNDTYWGWGRIDARAAVRRSYNDFPTPAASLQVVNGSLASGNVGQVANSDNQRAVLRRDMSGENFPPLIVVFESHATNQLIGRLDFICEGFVDSPMIRQTTELYDFLANQYVVVDSRVLGTTESVMTITPTNPQRFRQSSTGTVRARMSYDDILQDNLSLWNVSFDRVAFMTATP